MARNTNYNTIDEFFDCNQSAVESAAIRTSVASRVSMEPCDNVGALSERFSQSNTSRKSGQSRS